MAKAAASPPKRGKATTKTATIATTDIPVTTKTAATAGTAKPRSRTPQPIVEAVPVAETSPVLGQTLSQVAQLVTRLDSFERKITISLSAIQAELQVIKDTLHAVQHAQQTQSAQLIQLMESAQDTRQAPQPAEHGQTTSEQPSETFLPIVADLIRQNLTEHLSPLTTALRRLEERVGFVSNRLKPGPGGPDRQKPWRRDQRDQRDQPPHFRSRGQGQGGGRQVHGQGQQGQQGQAWSPPSAASVQGHFAPRRFPSNGGDLQVGDDDD